MDKAKEAIKREGERLEADLTRLTKAHSKAEGKEAFWGGECGRLGRQVLRTRGILAGQKKLVEEKRAEAARAQRALELCQGEQARHNAELTRMEGQLKSSEEALVKARDDCTVI